MKTYETERLILRPFSINDANFLLKLYNSQKFIKYIGDKNIRTFEEAQNYIREKFLSQLERLGYGNFMILLKENLENIGSVGIFEREGLDVKDIGYALLEEFEGKGYAFEAAAKIKEIAFADFGIQKLSAITSIDNIASQKLIKKLGLVYIKNITIPNDPDELLYYEL